MTVHYEWDAETWDGEGDEAEILDHDHRDEGELNKLLPLKADQRLVLVRDVGNDAEGLIDRLWAYVTDGQLPRYFSDNNGSETGVEVPNRLRMEFIRNINIGKQL